MSFRPIASPAGNVIAAIDRSIRTSNPIKIADLENAEKERLRRESIAQQRERDNV